MARFFQSAAGDTGLRSGSGPFSDAPIPDGAEIVEFDEETNADLIDSLSGKNGFRWQDHAIVAGTILRRAVPVTINPPRAKSDIELLQERTIALALVVLDAVNEQRQWDAALKAAFQNNGTFATVRAAILAMPNTPDRTRRQLLDAVRQKLDDGSVN